MVVGARARDEVASGERVGPAWGEAGRGRGAWACWGVAVGIGVTVGAGVTVGMADSSSRTYLATRASTVASILVAEAGVGTGVGRACAGASWGEQARAKKEYIRILEANRPIMLFAPNITQQLPNTLS